MMDKSPNNLDPDRLHSCAGCSASSLYHKVDLYLVRLNLLFTEENAIYLMTLPDNNLKSSNNLTVNVENL